MKKVQLIEITPEELSEMIVNKVETILNDLKENFQPKEPTEFLTRTEVAKMFQVDISTVHNWSKPGGKLKRVSMGSRIYYRRKEVEAAVTEIND